MKKVLVLLFVVCLAVPAWAQQKRISNVPTADALSANGANCSAGSAPLGVDASGAAESCTDYEEDLSNSAGLAAALSDESGTGAVVFASGATLIAPALGTPVSGTLTNATGLPISTGVSGLGSNVATALATPSSANIAAAITNESGTGFVVFSSGGELAGNKAIDGSGTLTGAAHHCFEMFPTVQGGDVVASSSVLYSVYVPFNFTLTSVPARVTTTGTTSVIETDLKENGVSVLSTLVTIDPNESNTTTAATPAVISDSAIAAGSDLQLFVTKDDNGGTGAGLEEKACGYFN